MIYVIPDTNQLYVSYKKPNRDNVYNDFLFSNTLDQLIDIRNSLNCIDEVTILMPEIVIDEMIQQKYEQYLEDYDIYQTLLPKFGLKPTLSRYNQDIFFQESKNQASKRCKDYDVKELPLCEHYFKEIIDHAIYKKPPFEGKDGKSDKGFKDSLLFYSIIEYATQHKGEYYLLSNDTIFTGPETSKQLKHEFSSISGCLLNIISNLSDLKANITIQKSEIFLESLSFQHEDYKKSFSEPTSKKSIPLCQKRVKFDGDAPIIKILNNKLDSIYNSDIYYYENFCSSYDNNSELIYESTLKTMITYNSGGLLSLVIYDYKYLGGAHDGTVISAYTFDINNGRQLSLTQLLKLDNHTLCERINSCIKKDKIDNEFGKYYEDIISISDSNSVVYYIRERKIHIVFNEYELGPFSSGNIDLILCDIP